MSELHEIQISLAPKAQSYGLGLGYMKVEDHR